MLSPLLEALQRQIIPRIEKSGLRMMAVAAPSWKELKLSNLPEGMQATRVPLRSKRKPVKGKRQFGNTSLVDARWPKDKLHSFRAPMLAYVLSGYVTFPLGGYELNCSPGHSVLIPPGVAYSNGSHLFLNTSIAGNTSCKMFKMRPYNGGLECWLSHTQNGEHWSHREADESCRISSGNAIFYLEAVAEELLSKRTGYKKITEALLIAFVNIVFRELQEIPAPLPALSAENTLSSQEVRGVDPILRAKEYIHNHLGERLTIPDVARYVYMSERSFTSTFKKQTGQTFLEYLTDLRFEKACNLLKTTDWNIEQVSGFIGIKPGRLRTMFHHRLGVSPTHFRKN